MKIYLVGGAVRDQLLGLTPQEHDWVVVGASPQELLDLGYLQVGKSFPVFLHPETRDEYALARTERKVAPGYTGFEFSYDTNVTLDEDLRRRDLTINAIARDELGQLFDPYGGAKDLEQGILRHVSAAFAEDPVRILRVARFAARFHHLGFSIADETLALMRAMVDNGEVNALVAERVWKELEKALATDNPQVFIEVLRQCGALDKLFPEINRLFGVPQKASFHPEVDTGIHTLMVLQQAALLTEDLSVRFAALVHDLGKGTTPADALPSHKGHEQRSVPLVKQLCQRLRTPKHYQQLAEQVAHYHLYFHRAFELKPTTLLKLFKGLGALQQPKRLSLFLTACEADSRGRKGMENNNYDDRKIHFENALQAALSVDTSEIIKAGFEGKAFADELHQRRVNAIKHSWQQD